MRYKRLTKKFLIAFSMLSLTVFILIAVVCFLKNYFYAFLSPFFSYLDSIGINTMVLLLTGGAALILGIIAYLLYDKM